MSKQSKTNLPLGSLKTGAVSGADRESGLSRREVLQGLGGLALSTAVALPLLGASGPSTAKASSGQASAFKSSQKLTSAYIPILDCVPLVVAYEKGFFKQAGIQAEKPTLIRAWPALLEAFTAKQALLTHILLPQVIVMRYARNVPVRSVAFNHTDVVSMLLAKNVPSIFQLGGKVVGCPTWWAPHTGIFQDVLRAAGLKPVAGKEAGDLKADEVAFSVLPPPDMVEGLKSGRIAGCTVSEPFGAAAEVLAEARIIKFSGDVWRDHPCCQSVFLEETIRRDRPWAEAVTGAIYRAALWAYERPQELAEMLGSDGGGYFPMPKKVIARALTAPDLETYGPKGTGAVMHTGWGVRRVKFVPYPYPSAFDVTIEMMRRMVVDPSVALSPSIAKLSGKKIAEDVVDYDLARKGIDAAGGPKNFGVTDSTNFFKRAEQYEVLLKTP